MRVCQFGRIGKSGCARGNIWADSVPQGLILFGLLPGVFLRIEIEIRKNLSNVYVEVRVFARAGGNARGQVLIEGVFLLSAECGV